MNNNYLINTFNFDIIFSVRRFYISTIIEVSIRELAQHVVVQVVAELKVCGNVRKKLVSEKQELSEAIQSRPAYEGMFGR